MSSSTKLNWICGSIVLGLGLMLWLPIGQYPFLIQNWMKVSTFFIPFMLLVAFSFQSEGRSFADDPKIASTLMLTAYFAHQFEEHWIDLLGQHYAFYKTVNDLLNSVLNANGHFVEILTPEAIFIINTSLVWLVGVIAIWRSPYALFPSLALAGIVFINAITHIVGGILKGAYNPGLLTSLVIFIPLAGYYYLRTLKRLPQTKKLIIASLGYAVIAHILMVGGMLASTWYNLIPPVAYYAVLILWSILPAVIFRHNPNGVDCRKQK